MWTRGGGRNTTRIRVQADTLEEARWLLEYRSRLYAGERSLKFYEVDGKVVGSATITREY